MPEVAVRVRYAKSPDAIETFHVTADAQWDTLQSTLLSKLDLTLPNDEELYCVFINSAGKVGGPVICGDSDKFWRMYGNKYSIDTTDTVLFEVNTRQLATPSTQSQHRPSPLPSQSQSQSPSQHRPHSVRKSTLSAQIPPRSPDKADIYTASKTGNLAQVQDLIKHHTSTVNARDEHSSTPLHYAAENGHLPLVTFLISQKAFKNNRNSQGMTPLLNAVANGHLDIVKYLISERAFTFVLDNEGNGPLHLAAKHNHHKILEWLLANGSIDKSLRNSNGEIYSAYVQTLPTSAVTSNSSPDKTAMVVSKYNNEVLNWRLVCTHHDLIIKQDQLAVLADIDLSSWQTLCFGLLTRFNIEGLSTYIVKDKFTFKILPKDNEDLFRAIPSLIDYIVLVEVDGDEGSGHVKDISKFYKILNKIYRPDDNMTFEMHVNGHILKKYQDSFQNEADYKKSHAQTDVLTPQKTPLPHAGMLSSPTSNKTDKEGDITTLTSDAAGIALEFEDNLTIANDEDSQANEQDDTSPALGNNSNNISTSRSVRDNNRRLHISCATGNFSDAQMALAQQAEINSRDDQLSTPLHHACQHGHLPLCQLLIETNCFKNNRNSQGMTPLLNAVANGHLDIVKYLISERAFTFVLDNEGNGPLHLAAKHNHHKILEWLLDNCDIDTEITNEIGEKYLFYVVEKKSKKKEKQTTPISLKKSTNLHPVHEILPENFVEKTSSADHCEVSHSNSNDSIAPISSSVSDAAHNSRVAVHRTEACVKACLANNYDIAFQFLEEDINRIDVNGKDEDSEMSLLHISCLAGEVNFVDHLLHEGALVNAQDKKGNTPLHYASQICHFEIMSLLQAWKADIISNECGSTPLHEACFACINSGDNNSATDNVVKFLMSMGASVKDIDYSGNTSLHFVVESQNTPLCLWMCQQPGTDECVYMVNVIGLSPYDMARNSGQIEVATTLLHLAENKKINDTIYLNSERLLEECVSGNWAAANVLMKTFTGPNVMDLNWMDEDSGKNAIHFCAEGGDLACVSRLISLGADIDVFDSTKHKLTPLHYACAGGYVDVVSELLSHGATLEAEDQAGFTPLFHACCRNRLELGCVLVETYHVNLHHVNWKTQDSILHLACQIGSVGWIQLIEKCSELTILSELKNNLGQTPIDVAINAKHTNIILYAKEKREERKIYNVKKCAKALWCDDLHAALDVTKAGISPNAPLSHSDNPMEDVTLPTLFHLACEKGDLQIVKEFILQGGSVSLKDCDGLTPLHYACMGFRPASILHMKDDPDQHESTEVEYQSRQLEIIRWLKKSNADINAQDKSGMTPLLLACLYGNVLLAQWLIDRGGDIHKKDNTGRTVIHVACESGSLSLVKWLLQEIQIKPTELDASCTNVVLMNHAAQSGNVELLAWMYHSLDIDRTIYTRSKQVAMEIKLQCLIKHQEKKFRQAAYEDNINVMDAILSMTDMPIDINSQESPKADIWGTTLWIDETTGDTALHRACRGEHVQAVSFLLDKMANVNAVNQNGLSPLHLSAISGNFALFDILLDNGADVNILDKQGSSILTFSCMLTNTSMAERISGSYTQFSEFRPNLKGQSPLSVATEAHNLELVLYFAKNPWISRQAKKLIESTLLKNIREIEHLIETGVSVSVCSEDSYRRTPLHIAVSQGNLKIIQLLLQAGASVETLDSSDRNALHIASLCGAVEVVKLLLEEFPSYCWLDNSNLEENTNHDVILQAVDELGMTPVAHACLNGQMITAAYLIGQGANLTTRDIYGSTILHLACKSGNLSLVQWLMDGFDMDCTALNYYKQTPLDIAMEAHEEDLVQLLSTRIETLRLQEEHDEMVRLETERQMEIQRIEKVAIEQEQAKLRWETEERENLVHNAQQDEAKHILLEVMTESLTKACHNGALEEVREILTCDINPNMVLNEEDQTGLHIATSCGHTAIVALFLQTPGVDRDLFDHMKMTALHIACAKGDDSCIEVLMNGGCDPLLAHQATGQCAIDILCSTDNADLLRALLANTTKTTLNRIQESLTKREKSKGKGKGKKEKKGKKVEECDVGTSLVDRMIIANSYRCLECMLEFITPSSFFLEARDAVGKTTLNAAATLGHLQIVKILLTFHPEVDSKDYQGLTPVMNAILAQSLEIVKILVNEGASMFEVDIKGNSPLHLCCDRASEIAVWFIQGGADIYCENAEGYTPLQLAEEKQNDVLIRLLKNKQNNVLEVLEVCESGDIDWLRSLIKNKVHIHRGNKEKVTGLHVASFHGHIDICLLLIAEGSIILDVEDCEGRTPVHYACMGGNVDMINVLVDLGASVFRRNSEGESCLHFVVQSNASTVSSTDLLQCLTWLVESKNMLVDICSDDGTSVLMAAARAGNLPALKFLHQHGASILPLNHSGCNAFHVAVEAAHTSVASWLLEHYATDISIDTPDAKGRTAFMIACENHSLEAAKWLYHNGCNFKRLGSSTDVGDSPLHTVCRHGDQESCMWLLDHAANKLLVNSNNETPFDVARINGFDDLATWLDEQDTEQSSFEAHLQVELELSLSLSISSVDSSLEGNNATILNKCKSTELAQILFNELYALYLPKAKINEQTCSMDSYILASFLLNSAAAIGNLDNIRDLIFSMKQLTVSSAQANFTPGEEISELDFINEQSPSSGQTPLYNAVVAGHLRVCQFLLTHGARCNIPDHTGRSPLNVSKERKDRKEIYEVLVSYATPEDLCTSIGPVSETELYANHWMHADDNSEITLQLMKYCYLGEGHFDKVVQVIEDFGADVNYESPQSVSPLQVAANENHINLVKYLVDGGADINHVDRNNTSALMLACRNQNRTLALYLIHNRADLTIVDSTTGDSALHIICQNNMVDLMKDIIDLPRSILRRLDLKIENAINGNNLLHYAVLANSEVMTTLLLHQGVDINACNTQDNMNASLHYACMYSYTSLVELLLSEQAQTNISNDQGVTPLAIALHDNNLPLSRLLQTHGADVTELDPNTGDTFLHQACRNGQVETAKWLMRLGLDPNAENNAGVTATKFAHASGREDLLEWVLAWILAKQLNKPIEEVLTEAHTLPPPREMMTEAEAEAESDQERRHYPPTSHTTTTSSTASASSRPSSSADSCDEVELEEEENLHEDPSDMLEFD